MKYQPFVSQRSQKNPFTISKPQELPYMNDSDLDTMQSKQIKNYYAWCKICLKTKNAISTFFLQDILKFFSSVTVYTNHLLSKECKIYAEQPRTKPANVARISNDLKVVYHQLQTNRWAETLLMNKEGRTKTEGKELFKMISVTPTQRANLPINTTYIQSIQNQLI